MVAISTKIYFQLSNSACWNGKGRAIHFRVHCRAISFQLRFPHAIAAQAETLLLLSFLQPPHGNPCARWGLNWKNLFGLD